MKQETLDNWINGNFSLLDRTELIQIARYYECKSNGIETEIEED